MNKSVDEVRSREIADRIKSSARAPFNNAHKAVLATPGAVYVQGFVARSGKPNAPIEHGWIELDEHIIDPSLPYLAQNGQELHYFPAQRLSVKQLKAAIEEAEEDYPDDDPLPIYGAPPYEYYGDVMLGGSAYQEAFEAAAVKCRELNQR